jgi:endonuclease-3
MMINQNDHFILTQKGKLFADGIAADLFFIVDLFSQKFLMAKVNWSEAVKPLLKKYKGKKHPLDYGNTYQLLVMVVLSAQDSDKHINQIAPKFFAAFPNMKALSQATPDAIGEHISDVRNFGNKSKWLSELSKK